MQGPDQNTVVECEDLDDKPTLTDRLLLLAALLLSLPLYMLVLFLFDDPFVTGQSMHGGNSRQKTTQQVAVKRVVGLDFSPVDLKPIDSQEELIESMICTFAPRSSETPDRVYLRLGTFDSFSATGMATNYAKTQDKSWPDFALSELPEFTLPPTKTADLHFFCNFEARLPHAPALQSLAGPLDFCAMRDGSIVLEQTIAVGDEFEIEYLSVARLTDSDRMVEVATDSPYLALGFMDTPELRAQTEKIAGETGAEPRAVFKFVSYLESNGVYKTDYKQTTEMHPVKEFLLKSMTGYCQHFAASLMLFCRLHGIPARVASGFTSNKSRDNRYVIVEAMAHAWVEVLTEDGWKTVDVRPQRSDAPPTIASGVSLPSAEQLTAIKNQLKQENAKRYNLAESDDEAPRMPQQQVTNASVFEKAQAPGTVVKDKARAEKYKKESAEKEQRNKEERQTQFIKTALRVIVALILLVVVSWVTIKYAEKLLKWLLKLLKKKQPEKELDKDNEEALKEKLAEMLAMSEFELEGKDVIDLFNRFAMLMEARGVLPRGEHETPGEYFDRLCLELNFRPTDGKAAASCFEAELYGGQSTTAADVHKFLQFLQHILNKIM
ncbi:MAG: transglutaminase domain-containing protein [Candidatus Riflebacteria bacterium]|nr:transglutaminase domain-containing protein [Candidatus Riflebacteria bacterium]